MKTIPKRLYIDGKLQILLISAAFPERTWLFSQGKRWLRLTPGRLWRLIAMLGKSDARIRQLIDTVYRFEPHPERYLLPLGIATDQYGEYAYVVCPVCDTVHQPHVLDADKPCPACAREPVPVLTPGMEQDLRLDALARERLLLNHPQLFYMQSLSPNRKFNPHRRLQRDWQAAAMRIRMGASYRLVAKEFNCSLGLMHKRVRELLANAFL